MHSLWGGQVEREDQDLVQTAHCKGKVTESAGKVTNNQTNTACTRQIVGLSAASRCAATTPACRIKKHSKWADREEQNG